MKINYKNKDSSFTIPFPLWLVNLIPSGLVNLVIKHSINDKDDVNLKNIDFDAIKSSLKVLKNFKGLKILDIKNIKGEEISINI